MVMFALYTNNLSPSPGLNLGLPNTSQMLLPLNHQDSGIGAENITTSVVILIVLKSITRSQSLNVRGMTSTPKYEQTGMRNIPNLT